MTVIQISDCTCCIGQDVGRLKAKKSHNAGQVYVRVGVLVSLDETLPYAHIPSHHMNSQCWADLCVGGGPGLP